MSLFLLLLAKEQEGAKTGHSLVLMLLAIPYFYGENTYCFSFQHNPKNLDPSFKTDLELWDCLGRVKLYYS